MEGIPILLGFVKGIAGYFINEQGGLLAWGTSAILTGIYLIFLGVLTFLIGSGVLNSTKKLRSLKAQLNSKQDVQVYRQLFVAERNIIYQLILSFSVLWAFLHYWSYLPWIENNIVLPAIFSFIMTNLIDTKQQQSRNMARDLPVIIFINFFMMYILVANVLYFFGYLKELVL